MSNELLVVFYILATLAVAYLWFYPKVIGNNVKLMAWMDILVTGIPVGISALLFWTEDPAFRLVFFDTTWFHFTLIVMLLIEMPIFLLYLKARNLSKQYWAMFRGQMAGSDAAWASASAKSVEKQLDDTKWDGLRTRGAKQFLLWGSNIVILFGTGFLIGVGDNAWASYALIHILFIFVFWFLLRTSVRLIADAPDEVLDEMMIAQRNRSYLVAFRWLTALAFTAISALMVFAIFTDLQPASDGFKYLLEFTWPQVQAIFWLFAAYTFMLPSMAMISLELKRSAKR
ncbi:MAG: hypothetical protein NWQ88_02415 [Aquiluna sp.]|jgi:hypothetical protein|nr:hypothetical protein [Aquiluna sp.]